MEDDIHGVNDAFGVGHVDAVDTVRMERGETEEVTLAGANLKTRCGARMNIASRSPRA